MNRNWVFLAFVAVLHLAFLGSSASAQVVSLEDFDGPLPGEQSYPNGYNFFGGGVIDADPNLSGVDFITEEITETEGVGGSQSFKFSFDGGVNAGTYTYGGFGGFLGFFGENFGAAGGAIGEDVPGRYVVSFDLQVRGNDGDTTANMPVGGGVTLFKGDYEEVFGDLDGDPNTDVGFNIWSSTFMAEVTDPNGFTHISWNLGESLTAPTADALVPAPFFDDESTFTFQLNFNSGGFGNDPNNFVNIDNVQLEFIPADPGDFDGDFFVDGFDFLAWQRDPNIGLLSDWEANYPGPLVGSLNSIPEPSAILLILLGCWMTLVAPPRRFVTSS